MAQREDRRGNRNGREGGRGQGNARRDGRAKEAADHIAETEKRFAKEIEASAAAVRFYDGIPAPAPAPDEASAPVAESVAAAEEDAAAPEAGDAPAPVELETAAPAEPAAAPAPVVSVVDEDSVAAILARGRGRAQFCDLAVLDFASFTSPGGGYDRGAWAQEEALCAESFLFSVLNRQKAWYAENRRRNLNCNLYRNRGLVVPKVRFARDRIHAYADVIVVAAPNLRFAKNDYDISDDALDAAMRDRIKLVMAIADDLGHEKLILGAFGCGAFGWDASRVAPMFVEELASGGHVAREVVFAIPKNRFSQNHERFAHAFSTFPQVNEVSFEDAQKAAAAAAAVVEEADEDDEDWRKYLG